MSKVITYLTLVFVEDDPNWRWQIEGEEDQAVTIIEDAGIAPFPWKRERHLSFMLVQPLTPAQMHVLEANKADGLFTNFYIRDEITPDEAYTYSLLIHTQWQEKIKEEEEISKIVVKELSERLGVDMSDPEVIKSFWKIPRE